MNLRTVLDRLPGRSTSPDATVEGLQPPSGTDVAPPEQPQAATHRHLITRTDPGAHRGLWAYFVLPGVDQQFVSAFAKQQAYTTHMFRWADLIGRKLWVRGTLNPFPVEAYGDVMRAKGGRPTPEGTRSYDDLIGSAQDLFTAFDAKTPLTVLGVHVTDTPPLPEHLPLLAGTAPIPDDLAHLHGVRREVNSVTADVRGDGFNGRPIAGPALQWLIHASRGLMCPTPPLLLNEDRPYDTSWQDIAGFTGGVYATGGEFSPTTLVRAMRNLEIFERHVVVQPVERFEPRDLSRPLTPWLAWAVTQDEPDIGPVDYVMIGEILPGENLIGSAELTRRRAESQEENWRETGERVPAAVHRGIVRASVIEDEVTNGSREVAARFRGVVLLATSGATEAEALNGAKKLRSHAMREQRLGLADDVNGQYALYRAFTPGAPETCDPAVLSGHVTQMPLYYLATAIPNGYAASSDQIGMPLGSVAGSTDVFVHDPHGAPQRNVSGLTSIIGAQGAGKSSLVAAMVDWSVAAGHPNVVTDPSGQIQRIAALPWNRDVSYTYDLSRAKPGVAVPSLLIPDPRREDFPGAEYATEVAKAAEARRDVTMDVFRELLPYQIVMSERGAYLTSAIEDVVGTYGSEYGADPWLLLDRLKKHGEHGREVERLLRVRAHDVGAVFFPAEGAEVSDTELNRQFGRGLLTVISMEGISVPPPNVARPMWTREQQRSAPLLLVSSLLATRLMYIDRKPKQVTMDEAGMTATAGGGASSMLIRAAAESRKRGATVNVVGQNPSMLTNIGEDVTNLVGTAFVGQVDGATAAKCLPLLGLDDDSGHEQTIASLAQGEFLVRRTVRDPLSPTGERRRMIRRIYVERSRWHPELFAALDTTPGEGEGAYQDRIFAEASVMSP